VQLSRSSLAPSSPLFAPFCPFLPLFAPISRVLPQKSAKKPRKRSHFNQMLTFSRQPLGPNKLCAIFSIHPKSVSGQRFSSPFWRFISSLEETFSPFPPHFPLTRAQLLLSKRPQASKAPRESVVSVADSCRDCLGLGTGCSLGELVGRRQTIFD